MRMWLDARPRDASAGARFVPVTNDTRLVYGRPQKVGPRTKRYLSAVIPSRFLKELGAKPGDRLRFSVANGRLVVHREEEAGA